MFKFWDFIPVFGLLTFMTSDRKDRIIETVNDVVACSIYSVYQALLVCFGLNEIIKLI